MTLRRAAQGRSGLQGGVGAGRAEIRRLWDWLVDAARARSAARRRPPGRAMATRPTIAGQECRDGRDRRLPERRQVDARQPADREPCGRRPRDPGVTRDRKELLCDWNGVRFRLVDTGGVDEEDTGPFGRHIADQARAADRGGRPRPLRRRRDGPGITPGDEELAAILRAAEKPVIVLANKIDDPRRDLEARSSSIASGSAIRCRSRRCTGTGRGDLLDDIVARLPGRDEGVVGDEAIRVAILGRPNVGKSSLLNALRRRERVIVSDVPGTTRDTIDTVLRAGRARRSCSSTPPACGASGGSARASSTTRSCARSRRPSEPTSRSCSSMHRKVSSSRTSPLRTSRARRAARRSSSSPSGTSTQIDLQETPGLLNRRLRQRPPAVAVSAKTGRGLRATARPRRGAVREARRRGSRPRSSTARSAS